MSLRFEVHGSADAAETVVLSAGLGGAGAFWHPQVEALAVHHRVVAYDHRGTGANAEPLPRNYSIAAMADDVVGILDELGVERCAFVGHALGGLVGLDLALRERVRVDRLVLVNAWAKVDSQTRRCFAMRKQLLLHVGAAAYVAAQPVFLYPAPWLSCNEERITRETEHGVAHFQGVDNLLARIAALEAFDVSDRLGAITVPVLVAAARDDILVPWTASEHLAAGLAKATLWVTPEGGHGFTVTEPETFNAAMMDFFASARS